MNQLESSFPSSISSNTQRKELEKLKGELNNFFTVENEATNQLSSLQTELAKVDEELKELNFKEARLVSSLEKGGKEV